MVCLDVNGQGFGVRRVQKAERKISIELPTSWEKDKSGIIMQESVFQDFQKLEPKMVAFGEAMKVAECIVKQKEEFDSTTIALCALLPTNMVTATASLAIPEWKVHLDKTQLKPFDI